MVVFKAVFLYLFDNVMIWMFVDVLEPALAGHCPAHEDAQFCVTSQVADKVILVLMVDMFPHFEALDEVEGLFEDDLFAKVPLLHVGSF